MSRTAIGPCFALLAFIAPAVVAQPPIEFSNFKFIKINSSNLPDENGDVPPAVATPYPSTITASGFAANETIEKITVTLHRLTHGTPDDIDMMLVGPTGENIVLFSDAGGGLVNPDAPEVVVTVTLDDDAAQPLPDNNSFAQASLRPANYELLCGPVLTCRGGCPPGIPECGGVCVNLGCDNGNCGACGVVCPPDTTCEGGVCEPLEREEL